MNRLTALDNRVAASSIVQILDSLLIDSKIDERSIAALCLRSRGPVLAARFYVETLVALEMRLGAKGRPW